LDEEPTSVNPEKLLFAKTHEWVALEDQGGARVATVGISAFAVESLTDLVFIELPQVGQQVTAGETFGEVESVKAVSDLYSPVSGEVVAMNSELPDHLEILSEDCYGKGWMIKVKLADDSGLDELLDFAAYEKQCAEEH
jgi:glycine cleavage system H protein